MFPRKKTNSLIYLLNCLTLASALEYDQCELIRDLAEYHSLSFQDALGFTCVAQEISELRTTFANSNGAEKYFGIFGISEGKACKFGETGICGVTCDKFLDDDVTDDLECLKTILRRTLNRPKSFKDCEAQMWKNVYNDCKNEVKELKDVVGEDKDFFKLADFYSIITPNKRSKKVEKGTKPSKIPKTNKPQIQQIEKTELRSPVIKEGKTIVVTNPASDATIRITIDLTKPNSLPDPNVTSLKTQKPFIKDSAVASETNERSSIGPGIAKPYFIELYHHLTQTTLVLKYELYPPYEEEKVGQMMKEDLEAMRIRGWDLRGPFEDKAVKGRRKQKRGSTDDFRLRQIQIKN